MDFRQRIRRFLLLSMIALLAAAFGCGIFSILYPNADPFYDPSVKRLEELMLARQKWETRTFTHYRMTIEHGACRQDLELRSDEITTIHLNTCHQKATTIPMLFEMIKQDIGNITWINGGCDVLLMAVEYDRSLGYPVRITYRQEIASPSNTGWLNYAKARPLGALDSRPCTLLGMSKDGYLITRLTILD